MILVPVSDLAVDDIVLRVNGTAIYTITQLPAFEDYPYSAAVQFPSGMQDVRYWAGPDVQMRVNRT